MGVYNCDNMLLLMGVSREMDDEERVVINKLIVQGFRDCAQDAGTFIRGGQTILNPWLMIGGVATSICTDRDYIMPNQIQPGDLLVLTKPLGTQVAVNTHQWMLDGHTLWNDQLSPHVDRAIVSRLFESATQSMAHLNRNAAKLMHKYGAHGCTDITGFGILGHAENLVRIQQSSVLFHIHTLPCLAGACQLSSLLDDRFKLFSGLSPETSGGLLVALPAKSAETFCRELTEIDGNPAWIIGEALTSTERKVILAEKPVILEVNHCDVPQSAVCCEN